MPEPQANVDQLAAMEFEIAKIQNAYLQWWGDPGDENSRVSLVMLNTLATQKEFVGMSLDQLDDYACEMSASLGTINEMIPMLEEFFSTTKAWVSKEVTLRGTTGYPYKDQVEGDTRVAEKWKSYRMVERLSATITHQLKSIDGRNFRIGQEIKVGLYTNQHSSK